MAKEDDILDAVMRKIGIARFHLAQLRNELAAAIHADIAPLPVQAHLGGVVAAADAAVDKVGYLKRRLERVRLADGRSAYEHFYEWRSTALVQHLRILRNRAPHSAYFKRPVGHTWSVPDIGKTGYYGPHELEPYCEAIVVSLGALEKLLASAAVAA